MASRYEVVPSRIVDDEFIIVDHHRGAVARIRPYRCRTERPARFTDRREAEMVCSQLELAAATSGPYRPTGPVVDGIETTTGRLACCGAGPDRQGEHLPACPVPILADLGPITKRDGW